MWSRADRCSATRCNEQCSQIVADTWKIARACCSSLLAAEHCTPSVLVARHAVECYTRNMLQRRSRMRRTRTGRRIELTPRDIEIFRVLARYRYLPSTYIYAFVGGASETRFKERLGDLFHEGYLDRPGRQWDF